MEAFEAFVALTLEDEGLGVSEAMKFPVRRKTKKANYGEWQTHGFEVDLVGARSDKLVLATVKSFFGCRGVVADQVTGGPDGTKAAPRYAILNNPVVRDALLTGAG